MRVFVEIPDSTWQSIIAGWDWALNQGVRLLPRDVKSDWFDLYLDYIQQGLMYGLRHEFHTFRSFGVDTIVDFAEMVLETDGRDWQDAMTTMVYAECPLGTMLEDASETHTYFDMVVEILQGTMLTEDTLEILGDDLAPKLSDLSIELDRLRSVRIDTADRLLVINYD